MHHYTWPNGILTTNRRLTNEEWAIVREHPRRGVELLKRLTFLNDIQPAILYHHERRDGTGYPEGLSSSQIPLEAKILAVVNSYDAMTSARPYRPRMSHETAAAELRRCANLCAVGPRPHRANTPPQTPPALPEPGQHLVDRLPRLW